jgi:hypothetical protein
MALQDSMAGPCGHMEHRHCHAGCSEGNREGEAAVTEVLRLSPGAATTLYEYAATDPHCFSSGRTGEAKESRYRADAPTVGNEAEDRDEPQPEKKPPSSEGI